MDLDKIIIILEKDGWRTSKDFLEHNEEYLQALIDETEKQLTLTDVVKSLPTDEEIYSEGCSYVRKIEQPNRQPLITLRRTFKAGAEFVKKQLYN